MRKSGIVHTEVTESKSYALLLGSDIPFLADVLRVKLEEAGCIVHKKAQKNIQYDYLLVFGAPLNLKSEFTKLKNGGKAVFMITDEHKLEANDSQFPIVSLSSNKQFSAESLASTILKKLFTAQPYRNTIETVTEKSSNKKAVKNKKVKTIKNHEGRPWNKIIKGTLLVGIIFLILAMPLIIFAMSVSISARSLRKASDLSISLTKRRESIATAKTANRASSVLYDITNPVISIVSSNMSEIGKHTINILTQTTLATNEFLDIEATLAINGGSLKEPNANLFTTTLPDIQRRLKTADQYLTSAERSVNALSSYKDWWVIQNHWESLQKISQIREFLSQADDIISILPDVLAHGTQKKYLVLFQNNFELRATGGFIGSYGTITIADGAITDLSVKDVYEADGQLKGSVTPPEPIVKYLNQPNWFLRDSNWHPDFVESADQAEWFLKKELNEVYDGVIGIDLYVVQNILRVLDGVYVSDYQAKVTADDFFLKLQTDTHAEFFPGSSKKKDLISSLASSLMIELSERKDLPYASLLSAMHNSLEEKHILFSLHDTKTQNTINQNSWGGRIVSAKQETTNLSPYRSDYLMLVESNLGVNKSNYYIDREIFTTTRMNEEYLFREVSIYYRNSSPYRKSFFSGLYKNYLRVLIPSDSRLEEVIIDDTALDIDKEVDIEETSGKKSIGFLVTVEPQNETKVILKYILDIPPAENFLYQLMVQKQPGTDRDPFVFKIKPEPFWQIVDSNLSSLPFLSELTHDQLITVDFIRKIK